MHLWWHRLCPAHKMAIKSIAIILLTEGLLWEGILLGKALQQIFWLRWRQMVVDIQPIQNVPYASVINQYGSLYNIDPMLIAAIIRCESSFNPRAVSGAGAIGLMQICIPTWQDIKKTQREWQDIQTSEGDIQALYQPAVNIAAGTIYLHLMLQRYQGDPVKAVAAYNAGPGSVDRYKGIPPYKETIQYVHHVAAVWREYRGMQEASVVCYQWGYMLEHMAVTIQTYILWGIGGIGCVMAMRHWMYRRKRRW